MGSCLLLSVSLVVARNKVRGSELLRPPSLPKFHTKRAAYSMRYGPRRRPRRSSAHSFLGVLSLATVPSTSRMIKPVVQPTFARRTSHIATPLGPLFLSTSCIYTCRSIPADHIKVRRCMPLWHLFYIICDGTLPPHQTLTLTADGRLDVRLPFVLFVSGLFRSLLLSFSLLLRHKLVNSLIKISPS